MKWQKIFDYDPKTVVVKRFAFLPVYCSKTDTYIWFETYYVRRKYYMKLTYVNRFVNSGLKLVECIDEAIVNREEYENYVKNPTDRWKRVKWERVE